jgi:hypothetical protein
MPLLPGDPRVPPPGPVYRFLFCLVLAFVAGELLVGILPKDLRRKVNQLRFGRKGRG